MIAEKHRTIPAQVSPYQTTTTSFVVEETGHWGDMWATRIREQWTWEQKNALLEWYYSNKPSQWDYMTLGNMDDSIPTFWGCSSVFQQPTTTIRMPGGTTHTKPCHPEAKTQGCMEVPTSVPWYWVQSQNNARTTEGYNHWPKTKK